MDTKKLEARAARLVGRIAYNRAMGWSRTMLWWRLRQTCRQLAACDSTGEWGEEQWFNLLVGRA